MEDKILVIDINDTTTIREIEALFSGEYPFLNIIFIHQVHEGDEESVKQKAISVDTAIGEIKKTHVSSFIEIEPWNTIVDVEKEFRQRFGLLVEILRKSDSHWILPAGADHLTLREQNELGRAASEDTIHPDYDTRIEDDKF